MFHVLFLGLENWEVKSGISQINRFTQSLIPHSTSLSYEEQERGRNEKRRKRKKRRRIHP